MSLALAAPACETREIRTEIVLESGRCVPIAGRLTGPAGAPVDIVLGGISSGRIVADTDHETGWWREIAGPGRALDTDRIGVLSLDFLGEDAGACPTTQDQARACLALADAVGVGRFGVTGSSYGGMIALALAALAPDRVRRALVISAAHRPSAMAQAWRSIQRDTVELSLAQGDGRTGLNLARRLAMTTYRTPDEIESRFYDPDPDSRDAAGIAQYLQARGDDFCTRMTPQRFLALSRSMDAHAVRVETIECPVTYLAVSEDRLVPVEQIAEAAGRTANGRLRVIKSFYGHDAFLKEVEAVSQTVTDYLGV